MPRVPVCSNSKHQWVLDGKEYDDGIVRDKCTTCGTKFPCVKCDHWDCADYRVDGREKWLKENT